MNFIPEEQLPDYFKDESRRNVLYAPLRSKTVNPNDFNSKIVAWKELIDLYCTCNMIYAFTIESLKNAFRNNGRTPNCLNDILEQMLKNGDIQPVNDFLQDKSKTWKEWISDSFMSVPKWSWHKLRNFVLKQTDEVEYVPIHVLIQEGDLLVHRILSSSKNKVMTLKELMEIENKTTDKLKDLKILLTSLHNRRKIDIKQFETESTDFENILVKFSEQNEKKEITEVDIGIYKLEKNELLLQRDVETLEDESINCVEQAKIQLAKGHRQSAKACLRKKHEIESRINKKAQALQNVQVLLTKLQDTKLNEGVWKAYKKAVEAFQSSYSNGTTEDAVEDTMLQVGEVLDIHTDIQDALARPITSEDADLEAELEELLKGTDENNDNKGTPPKQMDQLDRDMEKLILNLPSVPSSPTKTPVTTQLN